MKTINFDLSPSFSVHYIKMLSGKDDNVQATCTGFIYEYNESLFLVTNGHNITRMSPDQLVRISNSAAFPTRIQTKVRISRQEVPNSLTLSDNASIEIYEDNDFNKPKWYFHPSKGYLIDVVVIPIDRKINIPNHVKLYPINSFEYDSEYKIAVSDDVFILGYPLDIVSILDLPLWKRGTIATEPFFDINGLPMMYVDTATTSGMSGSPVIMKRTGFHKKKSGPMDGSELIGTITNFIGIYSGRYTPKGLPDPQLGIVWREEVIQEIINGKKIGTIDFQNK